MLGAALSSSFGKPTAASAYQFNSPSDALIDLKVQRRLGRFIPIWRNVDTIAHLRISTIPQRRTACQCDAQQLRIRPDLFQYLADDGAVRDTGAKLQDQ